MIAADWSSQPTLEQAMLGILNPLLIAEAEVIIQQYFAQPNVLELIEPLLISTDNRIRSHILNFLQRLMFRVQSQELPIPINSMKYFGLLFYHRMMKLMFQKHGELFQKF
jgi:hypothetical protein